MTSKTFYYSLLRYYPSYVLGEQVNIGIFFWFEDDQCADFIYPSSLQRIKHLYPKSNLSWLQSYLNRYKKIATEIRNERGLFIPASPTEIIEQSFGAKNAVNLVFDPPKRGTYRDKKELITRYNNTFLGAYQPNPNDNKLHNDEYLAHKFHNAIQSAAKDLVRTDFNVTTRKNTTIKFKYAWKNGLINLVQPLSFDYQKAFSIEEKAYRWFGKLNQIQDKIAEHNLHIDFLVASPQNPELHEPFNNALDIVKDTHLYKQLNFIREEDLPDYTENLSEHINPLNQIEL